MTQTGDRPGPPLGPWLALFCASGAAGLLYEVLWMRRLCLVFGATQLAVATVLSAFMAGLAMGAWVGGWLASRVRSGARAYVVAELIIAAWALLFPDAAELVRGLYGSLFDPESTGFFQHQAAHLAFMFALLLIPTAAMGATLPLLCRGLGPELGQGPRVAAALYGANTLGAVLGTWATTFVLLPALGVRGSELVGVGLNLVVAVAGARLCRTELPAVPAPSNPPTAASPGRVSVLLLVAISGAAAMALEVAWTRLLALILGSSVYAFAWMLVAFLLGHAGGALIVGWRLRRNLVRPWRDLAIALLCSGIFAAIALGSFPKLPFWFVRLYAAFGAEPHEVPLIQGILALFVMTPSTLGLGAVFPLATQLVPDRPARFAQDLSWVSICSTTGAAGGALIAGFVLIPRIGLQNTLLGVLGAFLLLAAGATHRWMAGGSRGQRIAPWVVAALTITGLVRARADWDPLIVSSGMYQYVTRLADWTDEAVRNHAVSDSEVLFHAEGTTTVVTVARSMGTGNLWLANNGKIDASTGLDMPTQVLLGHLPFLYRPVSESALVVGLASGITAGSVTLQERLRTIDVLEIEPAVILACRYFDLHNHRPLDDPRVRMLANDARNHLELYDGAYDVIINEPSNPWISGVSNLFTREYLELGRSRLAPRGVFAQWVQLYGMGTEDVRSLVATFRSVFPHVVAWSTIEDADLLLIGSRAELRLWPSDVEDRLAEAKVGGDLRRVGIGGGFDLLTSLVLDEAAVARFAGDAPLNTDDNARIEMNAPRNLLVGTSERNATALLDAASGPWPSLRPHLAEEDRVPFLLHLGEAWERRERWVEAAVVYEEAERRGAPIDVVRPRSERVLARLRDQLREGREVEGR